MKIAVAASGNTLEAPVDARFGRCAYFVVVDSDTMEFTAIENPGVNAGGGAGIQAAQVVASQGVQAVVAGNMGPNAHAALSAANIKIFPIVGNSVKDAVEAVASGNVSSIDAPNVGSHFGTQGQGGGQGMGRGRGA